MKKKVLMVGTGRWGSAFAIYLQRLGFELALVSHRLETQQAIERTQRSPYLPDYPFLAGTQSFLTFDYQAFPADIIFLSVPSQYLADSLAKLPKIPTAVPLVGINKGVNSESLQTIPEMVEKVFPDNPYCHLGGPCFPDGLLQPHAIAAETLAGKDPLIVEQLQNLLTSRSFRIYASDDVFGVAFLGALKNIFAIASGALSALKLNEEVFSILITRGMHEIKKLAESYQIKESTVYGLSGLGDLILTCYSAASSHNRNFGRAVVEQGSVDKVLAQMAPKVAEGYLTTQAVYRLNQQRGIESPIIDAVYQFLYHQQPLQDILQNLMQRPLKKE